jgi:NitT/TauT family transport system substrate-binding protein
MLVALLCFTILSLTCSEQKPQPQQLSVAYIENASCWPFFVAKEKGLLNKAGLAITIIRAADSSEALNALLAGKADVSIENTYSALFAIEANSPGTIKLFLPCSETRQKYVSHVLVPKGSTLKSVTELKGKRIGTYTGATQLITLRLFVKQYLNADPDRDVTIVQVAPPLQVQALAAGQYDALFTIEPFACAALAKGVATDLLPYARGKILDPFPAGACSVRASVITSKKAALSQLYDAMVRGADYIDRNPAEARDILAKWTGLDSESAKYSGGYEYHSFAAFDKGRRDGVQKLADLYTEADILSKPIQTGPMFLQESDLQ